MYFMHAIQGYLFISRMMFHLHEIDEGINYTTTYPSILFTDIDLAELYGIQIFCVPCGRKMKREKHEKNEINR